MVKVIFVKACKELDGGQCGSQCPGLISPATEWVKEGIGRPWNAREVPKGGG